MSDIHIIKEEEEDLPDPGRRIGARRNATKAEESGDPPRASPEI